jgi:hypothetical protein
VIGIPEHRAAWNLATLSGTNRARVHDWCTRPVARLSCINVVNLSINTMNQSTNKQMKKKMDCKNTNHAKHQRLVWVRVLLLRQTRRIRWIAQAATRWDWSTARAVDERTADRWASDANWDITLECANVGAAQLIKTHNAT